jgi:hypothetical protein
MVKYKALFLGLEQARKMGIKILKVKGYLELMVNLVRNLCEAKNPRLKRYKEVVWDKIERFDAFNIVAISKDLNQKAYSMASSAALFQPCVPISHTR